MNAQFNFKLPDDLLERTRKAAKEEGVSVGKFIKDLLESAVGTNKSRIELIEERLETLERKFEEKNPD